MIESRSVEYTKERPGDVGPTLSEQADEYQRQITEAKIQLRQLDEQISTAQEQILKQRKSMGGATGVAEGKAHIQKQIRILENRLDKALVKYNEGIRDNNGLRSAIENLRHERQIYDTVYKNLQGDLEKKKQEMTTLVGDANQAFVSRDAAQSTMANLRENADEEQRQFEHEWRELGKLIEQDRKMREFLDSKDRASEMKSNPQLENALQEENRLKGKLSKDAWEMMHDKSVIHMASEEVKTYEQAFEEIKAATGLDNIEDVVQAFMKSEEENFQLYNDLNRYRTMIDELQTDVADTKGTVATPKSDGKRAAILEDLRSQLQNTKDRSKVYEEQHTSTAGSLDELREGLINVMQQLRVSDDIVSQLDIVGVNQSTMVKHLGIVEHRVNEMLTQYNELEAETDGALPLEVATIDGDMQENACLGVGIGANGLDSISIVPPSTRDIGFESDQSTGEEPENRPISHNALDKQAIKSLQRGGQKY